MKKNEQKLKKQIKREYNKIEPSKEIIEKVKQYKYINLKNSEEHMEENEIWEKKEDALQKENLIWKIASVSIVFILLGSTIIFLFSGNVGTTTGFISKEEKKDEEMELKKESFIKEEYKNITSFEIKESINSTEDPEIAIKESYEINQETTVTKKVANKIDVLLEKIMDSTKVSSNPEDYITNHWEEVETIIKYGEEAGVYLYNQIQTTDSKEYGLKEQIMMRICNSIIENEIGINFSDNENKIDRWLNSIQKIDWTLCEMKPFEYKELDESREEKLKKLAADAIAQEESDKYITIQIPVLYGDAEWQDAKTNETKLDIYVIMCKITYIGLGNTFYHKWESRTPMVVTYIVEEKEEYKLIGYKEAQDGAYYESSIREFCREDKQIAESMLEGIKKIDDKLIKKSIIQYLKENGKEIKYISYGKERVLLSDWEKMDS